MLEHMPVDDGLCAVEDCPNDGKPQVCPYDQQYHRHGYIHYKNGHRWHPEMKFRSAWHGVCDPHYADIIIGSRTVPA